MPNEEMLKLITTLDTLGYRVVSLTPEKKQQTNGEFYEIKRTVGIIAGKK